ncbi:Collagen alpha-1(XV) chain [Cricetulus griseus]|uniref:Collagen alpha-1(XV) chain n=1 Tax=Cricetulus griseus TaxID=10029 RepID=G3H7G9_CRIGR|nr:Collagen alpha-1(XV) chain [Cricetulus griseus]
MCLCTLHITFHYWRLSFRKPSVRDSLGIRLSLWLLAPCSREVESWSLLLPAGSAAQDHLDLTELIGVPLPSSVSFVTGYGGFPAYSFGPGANVGRPARTLIPPTFFRDFAISVAVKPSSSQGGVLFAVTDAFQKVIYLGLRLSRVEDGYQRVILYYTEPGSHVSHEAAAFSVPVMTNRWNRFAVTVQGEEVALLMDCEEHSHVLFQRSARPLMFEPSAGIFVGNAGATGLERFTGSIQQLTIYSDPRTPEELCEAQESSASGEASGLQEMDEVAEIMEAVTYTQAPPKEVHVDPISMPPTLSSPAEDTELSGEPVPEGTPETNLSIIGQSSPEQGKSCHTHESGGSGEILNDTLEVLAVDGDPSTDGGSGDGALLNVTDGQVLSATATEEAKVPVTTTLEAEIGSMPTGSPTLAVSTQNTREEATLDPDSEENLATAASGDGEVPTSTAGDAEAGTMSTTEPTLSMLTQKPREEATLGPNGEEWLTPAVSKVPLGAFEEEEASGTAIESLDAFTPTMVLEQASGTLTDIQDALTPPVVLEQASGTLTDIQDALTPPVVLEQGSRSPTDTQATLAPTVAPEQVFTAAPTDGEGLVASTEEAEEEGSDSTPPSGPPLPTPTVIPERQVTLVGVEAEGSGHVWGLDVGSGSGDIVDNEDLLRVTALSDMGDMLQKAHLVIEGTFIYLKDSAEFFIRVRDGWKKLQLGELIPIPADSPPPPALSSNLHLVALNTPVAGDIRADFQCFQQARAAGLLSTFRAFLSSHLQDLSTVVRKAERFSLPIVNLKNLTEVRRQKRGKGGGGDRRRNNEDVVQEEMVEEEEEEQEEREEKEEDEATTYKYSDGPETECFLRSRNLAWLSVE